MELLDLPRELVEEILTFCHPLDVARVAQANRFLRSLVYDSEDSAIWRQLYLAQPLDDPRECIDITGQKKLSVDWKVELQRFVRAQSVVAKKSLGRQGELGEILNTLVNLVMNTIPKSDPLARIGNNLTIAQILLHDGWIDFVKEQDLNEKETQLVNQLHTFYGLTDNDTRADARVKSRSFVYNMKNYSWNNEFGPYNDDGTVNWVHVNAIRQVISRQLLSTELDDDGLDEETQYTIYPLGLPYIQPMLRDEVDTEPEPSDWAGVEGEWIVSFCFCDHRILIVFNDDITTAGFPRDTSLLEGDTFQEVIRCMSVQLKVTKTEFDKDHPTQPTIYFVGVMKNLPDTVLTGKVSATKEGYARWQFTSGEAGNIIWSSDGVQVGGIRSEYGVLGAWTTIFHDPDDPIGPFWLRKAQSSITVTAVPKPRA
ncbi:hypothetical protein CC2G_012878 [Coprinopsis cinerea AmutBmut pab1-1]|nr:hypothetical protein CC2G_012878 [Coprinopsis cinerea AmutBmut pab1-1]